MSKVELRFNFIVHVCWWIAHTHTSSATEIFFIKHLSSCVALPRHHRRARLNTALHTTALTDPQSLSSFMPFYSPQFTTSTGAIAFLFPYFFISTFHQSYFLSLPPAELTILYRTSKTYARAKQLH